VASATVTLWLALRRVIALLSVSRQRTCAAERVKVR
jgi:hypothetical protein